MVGKTDFWSWNRKRMNRLSTVGMRKRFLLIGTISALVASTEAALPPWATNTHPTDMARSRLEEITTSPHPYTVTQAGTMDGRNCRSPMGCGIAREGALLQTWESNRSVRMENVGETDVVNPWLSNGRKLQGNSDAGYVVGWSGNVRHVFLRGASHRGTRRQRRHHHDMVLRPGEALEWRWGQLDPVKHHGALRTMPAYPAMIYDGLYVERVGAASQKFAITVQ